MSHQCNGSFQFEQLSRNVILTLSGNLFPCDCTTLWLKQWFVNHRHQIADIDKVLCASGVPQSQVTYRTHQWNKKKYSQHSFRRRFSQNIMSFCKKLALMYIMQRSCWGYIGFTLSARLYVCLSVQIHVRSITSTVLTTVISILIRK